MCGLGLTSVENGVIARTKSADPIATSINRGDLRPLGLALVRGGCFHDQACMLIELGTIDDNGDLRCPLRIARTGSPQLLGVLSWWREVETLPEVCVPKALLAELNTVWALIPPLAELPAWAAARKEVGNRAEMYTVQRERDLVGNPTAIVWVARDSDSLGWDVEDRSLSPTRCIEVKGRRDHEVTFFLTANEWDKAQLLGNHYEVQFWGGIDLNKNPAAEFVALSAAGYPIIINDVDRSFVGPAWDFKPVQWRVSRL
jgi:Domain of unknown function (DUF3883)